MRRFCISPRLPAAVRMSKNSMEKRAHLRDVLRPDFRTRPLDARKCVPLPLLSICGHCLTSWKACKQVIPICGFGVDYVVLSSVAFRGRPPFLPASEAICRRRSGESFSARALPPMRANSVTVSGFFFMPAIYHAAGMQAADIRSAARAFSLIVASCFPERAHNSGSAGRTSGSGSTTNPTPRAAVSGGRG